MDLFCCKIFSLLDGSKADEKREQYILPKGEKDDRLDREKLENGLVRIHELLDWHVELNEAVHG